MGWRQHISGMFSKKVYFLTAKIVNIFRSFSSDKTRIIKNYVSLFLLQGSNYILPLITLPYLVRILGPEKYGLNAFATAFIAYFIVITDYGFIHTAPRRVAINKEDNLRLSQIFNSIMLIKFVLLFICLIIMIFILWTFSKFQSDATLYFVTFLSVLGNVLFPVWFFQGIEDMKYITIFNVVSKLLYTSAIFIFVKVQSDYILVPLFSGIGSIVVGIISLCMIRLKYNINYVLPPKKVIHEEFKAGWHVFLGMAAVSLNYNTNSFLLGILTNNTIVGYFKAAETLIRALVSMVTPILQATYPYVNRLAVESKLKSLQFTRKLLIVYGAVSFVISIILLIFAPNIILLIFGYKYINSIIVVQMLSFLPFLIGTSGILATQGLLAFELNKQFSTITFISGVINMLLLLVLTPLYQLIGISVAMLLSELFATLAVFYYLKRKGIVIIPKVHISILH